VAFGVYGGPYHEYVSQNQRAQRWHFFFNWIFGDNVALLIDVLCIDGGRGVQVLGILAASLSPLETAETEGSPGSVCLFFGRKSSLVVMLLNPYSYHSDLRWFAGSPVWFLFGKVLPALNLQLDHVYANFRDIEAAVAEIYEDKDGFIIFTARKPVHHKLALVRPPDN
jgi:hypothetical protein